jgi:SNF2 family DNA or RNA helicase
LCLLLPLVCGVAWCGVAGIALASHLQEGLDLTQANYVFISSPLEHYAKEAQMKARVSRLGQSRPTFVKHFVCVDTVEEHIYEIGRAQKRTMDPGLSLAASKPLSRQELDALEARELERLG